MKPLGVRGRLLLAFLGISAFALAAVLAAAYYFFQVEDALDRITRERVPQSLASLELSRQVERIVAAAPELLAESDAAAHRLASASVQASAVRLNVLLQSLADRGIDARRMASLRRDVQRVLENLRGLDGVLLQRIAAGDRTAGLLAELSQIQVAIERQLTPRAVRIEAESARLHDAFGRRAVRDPAGDAALLRFVASIQRELPLQKIKIESAAVVDTLRKAAVEPVIGKLVVLALPLKRSMAELDRNLELLDADLRTQLQPAVIRLGRFIDGAASIPAARRRELKLVGVGERLLEENKVLSGKLQATLTGIVADGKRGIIEETARAERVRATSARVLAAIVVLSLLSSVMIVWRYVDRSLVARLTALSDSMLGIAAGNLKSWIPPAYPDEIGNMTKALRVFRDTAVEVERTNLREIQETRRRLTDAIETISEAFALYDAGDRLIVYNRHFVEMMDIGLDLKPGVAFETIVEDLAKRELVEFSEMTPRQWIDRRLTQHRNPQGPFLTHTAQGRWLRVNERRTESGGTVAVYSDVTELKRRELELAAAVRAKDTVLAKLATAIDEKDTVVAELQAVLDAIDYGIIFLDRDLTARIANQAFRDMWNIRAEFIAQRPSGWKLIEHNRHTGVYGVAETEWDAYVDARVEEIRRGGIGQREMQRADGRTLLYQVLVLAHGGRMCTYFDITPLKRVEEALRVSEERYALAMEGAHEGLWDWNAESDIIFVSPRFREVTGLTADLSGLTSERWRSLIHPDDFEDYRTRLRSHLRGENEFFSAEYRIRCGGGEFRWVHHRGVGLRNPKGRVYRMAGSLADVSDRKQVEIELQRAKDEAEQANRVKSRFVANMSHELRTPLNAVIGITEMLLEDVQDGQNDEFAEPFARISNAGRHLLHLINEILDLSKIEAGRLELVVEDIDIAALVHEVLATSQPLADKNRNRLAIELDPTAARMQTDGTRLRQILLNLVGNACKFTRDGTITVAVCRNAAVRPPRIVFTIADTGIGMSASQASLVFDEFTQGDSSTTRKYGGTGLGLTICQRLCELMGGRITVDSMPQIGSTFVVSLPEPQTWAGGPMLSQGSAGR